MVHWQLKPSVHKIGASSAYGWTPIGELELLPHAKMIRLPRERPAKPIESLRIESSALRFSPGNLRAIFSMLDLAASSRHF